MTESTLARGRPESSLDRPRREPAGLRLLQRDQQVRAQRGLARAESGKGLWRLQGSERDGQAAHRRAERGGQGVEPPSSGVAGPALIVLAGGHGLQRDEGVKGECGVGQPAHGRNQGPSDAGR
jgi:hypothetical protein